MSSTAIETQTQEMQLPPITQHAVATLPLFERIGVIGRFRPLHRGSAAMLDAICENAGHAIIGIGSSNKYDCRNPFTAEEARSMVDAYLKPRHRNYEIVQIPDYGHIPAYADGKRWLSEITHQYGQLDCFVTGNQWVEELVKTKYPTMHPFELIPRQQRSMVKGTEVRIAIAEGEDWERLVPRTVAAYLKTHGLDTRLRSEFKEEILDSTRTGYQRFETTDEERAHVIGV
jgi:nicotinamide-nucleotide adenylyltransferase